MTVAALEADVLRQCLQHELSELPRSFFRASAKPVGAAWQLAVGADLALPEVEGPRSLQVRLANAYVDRVLAAAETDAVVADRFLRISSLIDPPRHLAHPALAIRVCANNVRRRRGVAAAPSTVDTERQESARPAHR
ncbi:hypothetical protein [Rhodococcus chondri]|uniref:hypothetical protein n=1 Tax=Rhodococcus chondri TaxID=3065941 RepID=UPI0038B5364E